jgi:hypothetical protein
LLAARQGHRTVVALGGDLREKGERLLDLRRAAAAR